MTFRFHIQNFQSIDNFEFDIKGFTTIVGPSNLGKSASIRALRAWAYNELHPSYIRDTNNPGKECILTGYWPEGNELDVESITFRKSAKDNIYTVKFKNGTVKDYPKIGSDTPDELKQLRWRLLETEREDFFNLNFQGQLDNLFLVTEQPTTLTSFLNKIFDIARYERALRNINSDILVRQREYDDLSLKSLNVKNRLDTEQAELTANTEHLALLTSATNRLTKTEKEIERLQRGLAAFAEVQQQRETLTHIQGQVATLKLATRHATAILSHTKAFARQQKVLVDWQVQKAAMESLRQQATSFGYARGFVAGLHLAVTKVNRSKTSLTAIRSTTTAAIAAQSAAADYTRVKSVVSRLHQDLFTYRAVVEDKAELYASAAAAQLAHAQAAGLKASLEPVTRLYTAVQSLHRLRGAAVAFRSGWQQAQAAAFQASAYRTALSPILRLHTVLGNIHRLRGASWALASAAVEIVRTQQQINDQAVIRAAVDQYDTYIRWVVPMCPTCHQPFPHDHPPPTA